MSTVDSRRLVQKLWNYCDVLRDDGVSTIDYVEQLTFLLFLKMADERARRSMRPEQIVPDELSWQTLLDAEGDALEVQYRHILTGLAKEGGTLGTIFRKAQNKIQDPAKLKRLIVDLIDKENWSGTGVDVKGDAYEELLARGAEDTKSGAGQYFTPRALTAAMVDCTLPTPDDTITDPACGTGGFLLAAFEHIQRQHGSSLTPDQRRRLAAGAITGTELVEGTARLAAMNMLLHGIGTPGGESLITIGDALGKPPAHRYTLVLANPPFGRSSTIRSVTETGKASREEREIERTDFWAATANKQLNFVQHIASLLEIDGRAAVVLPDNVLFEGGAGETIRRRLLKQYDLHTLLRLPTGIFYAGGVKANVLFFERKRAREQPWTQKLWVYDFRTNQHFTLKQNPLRREHLQDFVDCYLPGKDRSERVETERFKAFTYDELIARDKVNLDITWLRDASLEDADALLPPEVIAQEIVDDLQAALREFAAIADALSSRAEPVQPSRQQPTDETVRDR
ncbi:type I restriction-modification system subunit M [Micromonospora endophytica]|uniref:site-specific DNA-methyltransferase (adenine-specific) n=1 Tax=Micromonospora endophytica TaxID=515350 RepID=A0A2W2BWW1_9ACTN|nr:class I SAM-dependent DNA methyltransferase [Micromonospora endophytica]PZF90080.1 DNA methyltransferase [Micromonospora endophytica]RIW41603.1 SAM-dependent DNA methyltransferase [Micromonospora endophytica]BCJ61233.1 DNA methyltransferase [Micromonospora endophytica]